MLSRYSNSPQNPLSGGAQMWMDEAKNYHGEPIGQGNFGSYGHYSEIPKYLMPSSLAAHDRLTESVQLNVCGSPPRSWEWPVQSQQRAVLISSAVTLPLATGLARSPTRWCATISFWTTEDNFPLASMFSSLTFYLFSIHCRTVGPS